MCPAPRDAPREPPPGGASNERGDPEAAIRRLPPPLASPACSSFPPERFAAEELGFGLGDADVIQHSVVERREFCRSADAPASLAQGEGPLKRMAWRARRSRSAANVRGLQAANRHMRVPNLSGPCQNNMLILRLTPDLGLPGLSANESCSSPSYQFSSERRSPAVYTRCSSLNRTQWPAGAPPPGLTLRRLSASGTAASASSVSTQKASM